MRKKILVSPVQTGLAHIVRSLAVAEELKKRYDVCVTLNPKKQSYFSLSPSIGIIKVIENLDNPLELLKYANDHVFLKSQVERYLNILRKVRPDLVVVDVNPGVMIASELLGIPSVQLIDSEIIPYSKGLLGFFSTPNTI